LKALAEHRGYVNNGDELLPLSHTILEQMKRKVDLYRKEMKSISLENSTILNSQP
jgi:hypothetical protein